jgi:hypothetical protein
MPDIGIRELKIHTSEIIKNVIPTRLPGDLSAEIAAT